MVQFHQTIPVEQGLNVVSKILAITCLRQLFCYGVHPLYTFGEVVMQIEPA